MTVIAAARTGANRVTIAADSEVTDGWQKGVISTPKLWVDGQWAFGAAGNLRVAQVLKYQVDWPAYDPEIDFEGFLVCQVVPAIRSGVKGHGVVEKYKTGPWLPMSLVIATGGDLGIIAGDLCVSSDLTGRLATGSGYAEALGSLGTKGPWRQRDVIEAAKVARVSAVGVGGPISVVDTKSLEVEPA